MMVLLVVVEMARVMTVMVMTMVTMLNVTMVAEAVSMPEATVTRERRILAIEFNI